MKDRIKPILVLFIICVVAAVALSAFNDLTSSKIAEQNAKTEQAALSVVMPGAECVALSDDEVAALEAKLVIDDEDLISVYKASIDGKYAGYIFKTSAKGYGGAVTVITGINKDGDITGVKVISHSETAGLGAKSAEEGEGSFVSQYTGKTAGDLTVVKDSSTGDNLITAITSATRTSRAVTRAVNLAGKAFELLGE